MPFCSTCKAPIIWARYQRADGQESPMPLDLEPAEDGKIALIGDAARMFTEQDALGGLARYRTHFSTCPDAGKHRKPRGKR